MYAFPKKIQIPKHKWTTTKNTIKPWERWIYYNNDPSYFFSELFLFLLCVINTHMLITYYYLLWFAYFELFWEYSRKEKLILNQGGSGYQSREETTHKTCKMMQNREMQHQKSKLVWPDDSFCCIRIKTKSQNY